MITEQLSTEIRHPELLPTFNFVGGEWLGTDHQLEVRNPADNAVIGSIEGADTVLAQRSVDEAHRALPRWSQTGLKMRQRCISDWADLIEAHASDLARIITLESGKPLWESEGEVAYGLSFLRYFAELEIPHSQVTASHLEDAVQEIKRQPLGVVALITPWNFPLAMLTRKASAALLAGCTLVATPALDTPLTALYLFKLAEQARFPAGVMNLVVGEPETIVTPWLADSRVRGLSFTGSTPVGKLLYRESAEHMRRLLLELGGHAPAMLFPSADLDKITDCIMSAKFATGGEDCLAINRLFVHTSLIDQVVDRLTPCIQNLTVGRGLDNPDIGAMIHTRLVEKLEAQVEDAVNKGAKLICGGKRSDLGECFFEPTLLTDVTDEMLIAQEETFGPILAILSFEEEGEVLRRANQTEYGLIAYIYSEDPAQVDRLTDTLEYGMVAVNRTKVTGAPIPFGGVKQSGLQREGGVWGYEAFTEIKYVCKNKGDDQ